jgi:hypothetical protein
LNDWVATQRVDGDTEKFLNAPNRLIWPDLRDPPEYSVPFELGKTSDGEAAWRTGPRTRRTAMRKGQYCFRWERPPQSRLLKMAEKGTGSSSENIELKVDCQYRVPCVVFLKQCEHLRPVAALV